MKTKEKQQFIIGIIFNLVIILGFIVVIFWLIVPKYSDFDNKIKEANDVNSKLQNLKNNGFNITELKTIVSADPNSKDIADLLIKNEEQIKTIISKPKDYTLDYDSWLKKELLKENEFDEEIENNNKILGAIIPTFISSYDKLPTGKNSMNKITLASLTTYIEEEILKKYNLESYFPISLANIVFDTNTNTGTNNIGSFTIQIDIAGKNYDIKKLLNNINEGGKLNFDEKGNLLLDKNFVLNEGLGNNLLITIKTLSLSDTLSNNSAINNGQIVLEFYVKGVGFNEFSEIKKMVLSKLDTLSKNIVDDSKFCEKSISATCTSNKGKQAIDVIKSLNNELNLVKTEINSLGKKGGTTDFNQEIKNLYKLYSSIQNIQSEYNKQISIVKSK